MSSGPHCTICGQPLDFATDGNGQLVVRCACGRSLVRQRRGVELEPERDITVYRQLARDFETDPYGKLRRVARGPVGPYVERRHTSPLRPPTPRRRGRPCRVLEADAALGRRALPRLSQEALRAAA